MKKVHINSSRCEWSEEQLQQLIDRYVDAQTTEEEERRLAEWFQTTDHVPDKWKPLKTMFDSFRIPSAVLRHQHSFRKIAAVAAILLCLSAISFAAFRFMKPRTPQRQTVQVARSAASKGKPQKASIRFDNVRLDSIMSVVGRQYAHAVNFCDEEPKSMRLVLTWNPDETLDEFVNNFNMFDYVRLFVQNDTIFVEQTEEEDHEE